MECAELAPAFACSRGNDSASKLDALHTLREVGSVGKLWRFSEPGYPIAFSYHPLNKKPPTMKRFSLTSSFTHRLMRYLPLLLAICNLQLATAATVVGNLTDISIQALDTKLIFTPTNNVLVTGTGLSAGPPVIIATTG